MAYLIRGQGKITGHKHSDNVDDGSPLDNTTRLGSDLLVERILLGI